MKKNKNQITNKSTNYKNSVLYKVIEKIFYYTHGGLFKKPYYYVKPCPYCNSKMTGRFIEPSFDSKNQKFKEKDSLRHGEIIMPKSNIGNKNCFCVKCNRTFHYDVPMKFISKYELEKEMEDRKTPFLYNKKFGIKIDEDIEFFSKSRSKIELKAAKKRRKKGIFNERDEMYLKENESKTFFDKMFDL